MKTQLKLIRLCQLEIIMKTSQRVIKKIVKNNNEENIDVDPKSTIKDDNENKISTDQKVLIKVSNETILMFVLDVCIKMIKFSIRMFLTQTSTNRITILTKKGK